MKKLGIDVDGVLRDLISEVNRVFKKHYPKYIIGSIAYNYDFPHINMPLEDKYDIIYNKYPEDIFLKAKPYPHTDFQLKTLRNWAQKNDIKLVISTSQEPHLIWMTYVWLGKYGFAFEELHVTKDKGSIGLKYLIDDSPHNYDNWVVKNGNLRENFFLMDRDWNQNISVRNRISNLSDIIKLIPSTK